MQNKSTYSVTCQLCQRKFKDLSIHLSVKHKMTVKQYLQEFPNAMIYDPLLLKRKQEMGATAMEKLREDPNYSEKLSVGQKAAWAKLSEEEKKKRTRIMREAYIEFIYQEENNLALRLRQREQMKKNWENPEFVEAVTEAARELMSERNKDPEWKEMMQGVAMKHELGFASMWKDPVVSTQLLKSIRIGTYGQRIEYTSRRGHQFVFRSSYELKFAVWLDVLNYVWEYEQDRIEYVREDGSIHVYIPDFYIPAENVYYEVYGQLTEDKIKKIEAARDSCDSTIFLVGFSYIAMIQKLIHGYYSKIEKGVYEYIEAPKQQLNLRNMLGGQLSRLKYVPRYQTFQVNHIENVAEHSGMVTQYAALIGQSLSFGGYKINFERLLEKALFHDIEEVYSGDMLRNVKYAHPDLPVLLKAVSKGAVQKLEQELGVDYIVKAWESAKDDSIEGQVVRLADYLSVLAYCVSELKSGNLSILSCVHDIKQRMLEIAVGSDPHIEVTELRHLASDAYFLSLQLLEDPRNMQR